MAGPLEGHAPATSARNAARMPAWVITGSPEPQITGLGDLNAPIIASLAAMRGTVAHSW
ncbi:MAG TPA: hypothetical protein VHY82_07425 [Acetobacteraceae bacterium]|nr:hypothetical protein [Acetobacteraceae bacterium]